MLHYVYFDVYNKFKANGVNIFGKVFMQKPASLIFALTDYSESAINGKSF